MRFPQSWREWAAAISLAALILCFGLWMVLDVPRPPSGLESARGARALDDLVTLGKLLDTFREGVGRYPTTQEGLEALRTAPAGVAGWKGPYTLKPIPTDPWGGRYLYEFPNPDRKGAFRLTCLGSDGRPGGEGSAADRVYAGWDAE